MEFDSNWKYKEVIHNLNKIRKEYILMCNSFDFYHLHDRVLYRTKMKKAVYSYPFSEARRNYIWQRLNKGYRREL